MDRINDRAMLVGRFAAEPELSHTGRDGEYYRFPLDVERLSGTVDRVNGIVLNCFRTKQREGTV